MRTISRRRLLRILAVVLLIVILYFHNPLTYHRQIKGGIFPGASDQVEGHVGLDRYVKSSFDWGAHEPSYPIPEVLQLPTGKPDLQPKIQFNFQPESRDNQAALDVRRLEIRNALQKCWNSYKKFAWMSDELTPLTGHRKDTFGGWAATLVDSLDTLWIMGLKEDFFEAVEAVATIDWANTTSTSANMFETTIRHLGGLLAAYDLSHERVLLLKAVELGDMLYAGFDTENHMPGFWIDYEDAKKGALLADISQPIASPASLSLEFTRLSQLTGDSKYYDAISRVTRLLRSRQSTTKLPGLWPAIVDMRNEYFGKDNLFTIGALADSAYEYLPKMHALMGSLDPLYRELSTTTLALIADKLLFRPKLPNMEDILIAGDVRVDEEGKPYLNGEGQHLSCFAGGMYALSGRLFEKAEYVDIGAKLTKGCVFAYESFPTGIMPEIFNMFPCSKEKPCVWDEDEWYKDGSDDLPKGFKNARGPGYLLRPEAIESVFIMYRITGKREYQEDAWRMFQAIMKATETEFGNAAIEDVTIQPHRKTKKIDSMESFWLAETLKYFYLIFSPPDLISLDEFVLNTEAHPLRRIK